MEVTDANRPRLRALAAATLGWIKAELTWTFAYTVWVSIQVAAGRANGLSVAFLPVMLAVIGATRARVQISETGKTRKCNR